MNTSGITVPRRTVARAVAWSVPVAVTAAAAPPASASALCVVGRMTTGLVAYTGSMYYDPGGGFWTPIGAVTLTVSTTFDGTCTTVSTNGPLPAPAITIKADMTGVFTGTKSADFTAQGTGGYSNVLRYYLGGNVEAPGSSTAPIYSTDDVRAPGGTGSTFSATDPVVPTFTGNGYSAIAGSVVGGIVNLSVGRIYAYMTVGYLSGPEVRLIVAEPVQDGHSAPVMPPISVVG